jgi:hypothetical protein
MSAYLLAAQFYFNDAERLYVDKPWLEEHGFAEINALLSLADIALRLHEQDAEPE